MPFPRRPLPPSLPALRPLAAALGLLLALPGRAQQDAGTQGAPLEEIIVTAQKRATSAQATPISLTAVGGDEIQDRGIVDLPSLAASIPGISARTNGPGQTEFEMRGMSSGGGNSPTVGLYLDDVPLTPPAGAQNGKVVIDPSLYDLARVEVLRGPQGTLYGAGSMGGTVKLVTRPADPDRFEGSAQAVVSGTRGGGVNADARAMLNLPLVPGGLALRMVLTDSGTSGWIDRIVEQGSFPASPDGGLTRGDVQAATITGDHPGSNAEQLRGARLALLWKPGANLTITPAVLYQRIHQDGPSAFDGNPGTMAHYQPFDIAEPYSDSVTISSLTLQYHQEDYDLTSVTARWHRLSTQVQDASENLQNPLDGFNFGGTLPACPAGPAPYFGACGTGPISGYELDPSSQFSEELRLASHGDGALQWVGGVFLSRFQSNWQLFTRMPNPGAFASPVADIWTLDLPDRIDQQAVFGEASYALTERLRLTGGLRWYGYRNTIDMAFSGYGSPSGNDTPTTTHQVQSNAGVNPRLNLAYDLAPDLMVYGTVAKGFRPGGGNQPLPDGVGSCVYNGLVSLGYANGAEPMTYKADTVWSYEAGEKARLLGGRLRLNASAYYEDWRDIQLEELPCNYPLYDNANSARIYGGEVELRAQLTGALALDASLGLTHATLAVNSHGYRAGDRLPDVAPLGASVRLAYRTPVSERVEFVARLENTYTGRRVDLGFPAGVPNTQSPLSGYDLTHLRLGLASDAGWNASVFVDNVLDRRTRLDNSVQLTLYNAAYNRISTGTPRTIGVDLAWRF